MIVSLSDDGADEGRGDVGGGLGDGRIRGPVHFERLATTLASKERSANDTLGCALISRHASFVGIVSEVS